MWQGMFLFLLLATITISKIKLAMQAAAQPSKEDNKGSAINIGTEKIVVDEVLLQSRITSAAKKIMEASALLITAGAGLGVDSGLPDFRGPEGFWKAYPPMQTLGIKFTKMSNPIRFAQDPSFAWGFWGHRQKLYKNTSPHYGFEVLKRLGESTLNKEGFFVYTSNVDGAFYKAGFDPEKIAECHGSVHWMQCVEECSPELWSAQEVEIDETTFRAADPLPACKNCGKLARPNVLMYHDYKWVEDRFAAQNIKYHTWMTSLSKNTKLVVIEIGAGTASPAIREESERRAFREDWEGSLIRINLRDPDVPTGGIALPLGGKDALEQIEKEIVNLSL